MRWLGWAPGRRWRVQQLAWLGTEVGRARLPRRKKPRPSEPRAQWHEPQVFPALRGRRHVANSNSRQGKVSGIGLENLRYGGLCADVPLETFVPFPTIAFPWSADIFPEWIIRKERRWIQN